MKKKKDCNENMVFSAISNILTNSIRIEALKKERMIRIRLSDDGAVLSDADNEHIFDRFYKGMNGQSGIGMALSREYTRLHQGDISLIRIDKTTFHITLPINIKSRIKKSL